MRGARAGKVYYVLRDTVGKPSAAFVKARILSAFDTCTCTLTNQPKLSIVAAGTWPRRDIYGVLPTNCVLNSQTMRFFGEFAACSRVGRKIQKATTRCMKNLKITFFKL